MPLQDLVVPSWDPSWGQFPLLTLLHFLCPLTSSSWNTWSSHCPPLGPHHPNAHSSQIHTVAGGSPQSSRPPSHYPEIPALNPRGLPGHASDIPNLIRPSYLHLPFLGDCSQKTISQAISNSSLPSSSLLGAFVRTSPGGGSLDSCKSASHGDGPLTAPPGIPPFSLMPPFFIVQSLCTTYFNLLRM